MVSGSRRTGIAVAQFAPTTETESNLATMRDLATSACEFGARVVVFPEYSSFFEERMTVASVTASERLDGPFVASLTAMAKVLSVHLVAGMLETADAAGRVHNTVVVAAPSGELVASYRKLHLYDAFGHRESDLVHAGNIADPQLFEVDGLTFALQTCYDIRFPELSRRLVDAGADVLLVPSEWVRGPLKESHWRTLLTARAIENTVYVAAADHAPPIGVGNSMVVDPMGVEIATIGETTDVAVGWASRQRIEQVRAVNPALSLRRFAVGEVPVVPRPGD